MFDRIFHSSFEMGAETPFILMILVALEALLSADNAIALATIARGLDDQKQQTYALNLGLLIAYVLRVMLIITAVWVIQFWQFSLIGAIYLLWLVYKYFSHKEEHDEDNRSFKFTSLWQAIPMIGVTDLAFSLDSVTTAIAVSDQVWLIIAGGTLGVITLRFLAQLFITWIEEYTHLQDAGFITVGFVGIKLLLKSIQTSSILEQSFVMPEWLPEGILEAVMSEWLMITLIIGMFIWGFSEKNELKATQEVKIQE